MIYNFASTSPTRMKFFGKYELYFSTLMFGHRNKLRSLVFISCSLNSIKLNESKKILASTFPRIKQNYSKWNV